jgi:CBS domain-containing protein
MRGKRMTIFLGDSDLVRGRPLYLVLLERLRAAGCAGATVTRGIAGFGAHSHVKTATLEALSADLPVVLTVIDTADRIDRAAAEVIPMLAGGLVAVEDTDIAYYSAAFRGGLPDLAVASVMTGSPETIAPDASVADALERMLGRDYTALPVVDAGGRLLGVVDENTLLDKGLAEMSLSQGKVVGADLVREVIARVRDGGARAADAMTPATTVAPTARLGDAAHRMHAEGAKRLFVVDPDGRLVGVLSRLDILASVAAAKAHTAAPARELPQEHARVGEIMDRDVPVVTGETPLPDVLERIVAARRVVVVDADATRRPIGIITDTDLLARVDPEERPGFLTVLRSRWNEDARKKVQRARGRRAADVMTAPAVTIADTATVMDALTLTVTRHVKRLPVVDAAGRLVGLVARPALLRASLARG